MFISDNGRLRLGGSIHAHNGEITRLALSADSRTLYTIGADNTLQTLGSHPPRRPARRPDLWRVSCSEEWIAKPEIRSWSTSRTVIPATAHLEAADVRRGRSPSQRLGTLPIALDSSIAWLHAGWWL
ncbi:MULTISPECIES: hypothetical protein [Nocardia]|uniref:hypothetical protein n=1 Tax=Nocardia TaxID=1817 RepID=UPI00135B685F|nr:MULTISPECIES: hypothetical protein [Nocardia]